MFKASDLYAPTGDQPQAVEALAEGLQAGERYLTLLGATGTGKTATIAWTIERVGRPALLIAHNKTLAAQLCNELREFFPESAVESALAISTRRSTRSTGSGSSASFAWASTTCSLASTCSARGSTCPRCRWWRSSMPTRRASCAARRR